MAFLENADTTAMGERRFRTKRQWHNLTVWSGIVPFVLLVCLIVGLQTGRFLALWVAAGLGVLGMLVAAMRDLGNRCVYLVRGDRLTLEDRAGSVEVPASVILDASPIDRRGARDYVEQRTAVLSVGRAKRKRVREFLRFCTVDIGMRSLSFGFGRRMIDRMPQARHDLVLLRLRDGREMVLSPVHGPDLIDSINRIVRETLDRG